MVSPLNELFYRGSSSVVGDGFGSSFGSGRNDGSGHGSGIGCICSSIYEYRSGYGAGFGYGASYNAINAINSFTGSGYGCRGDDFGVLNLAVLRGYERKF